MIKYPPLEFWKHFKSCNGAMSSAEAIFMYNACLEVSDLNGIRVEMGTHKGKSALVSLMAWANLDATYSLVMLEPECINLSFRKELYDNIAKFKGEFNGGISWQISNDFSTDFLPKYDMYNYIMWDTGSHGHELVSLEKPLLEDRIIKDGILVMHDINSQFTACTEAYQDLIASGKYEEIKYDWQEIFDYVAENNLEENNNSWHLYPELPHPPNFIGALKRK